MQMPPSSSAYIARLAMGKHTLREVRNVRIRTGTGRGHLMYPVPCLHAHTRPRKREARVLTLPPVELIVKTASETSTSRSGSIKFTI
jgi:hypothetical protein